MALPTRTHSLIARFLTSERFEKLQSQTARAVEMLGGRDATLRFFHDPRCARSWVLLEALLAFQDAYDVTVTPYLVPSPPARYVGDVNAYYEFSLKDAQIQARYYGLTFPQLQPRQAQVNTVLEELKARPREREWLRYAHRLGEELFRGNSIPDSIEPVRGLEANAQLMNNLGNYRGGTIFAHGAWYFGVDRLALIEKGYEELELGEGATLQPRPSALEKLDDKRLRFYFSFRSPFSYVALPRVLALAAKYDLELETLAVFTPETESRPAPLRMQLNLLIDAAREGRDTHVQFGRVNALSRKAHEELTAVFYGLASAPERQRRYLHAAMRAVWGRGVDFEQDGVWQRIQEEARIGDKELKRFLAERNWLSDAQSHGEYLQSKGYLSVPAFEIGPTFYWGYDRLTQLEHQLES